MIESWSPTPCCAWTRAALPKSGDLELAREIARTGFGQRAQATNATALEA
jgi:hypothetical protein